MPDIYSTGQLLDDLASELTKRGMNVNVISAHNCYGPPDKMKESKNSETRNGVKIIRLRTARFDKNRLTGRIANYLSFVVPLLIKLLLNSR